MTLFEYRETDDIEKARLIAKNDNGDIWECVIKLPYNFNHDFWYRDQDDPVVLNKSKELAKQNNASDWVLK